MLAPFSLGANVLTEQDHFSRPLRGVLAVLRGEEGGCGLRGAGCARRGGCQWRRARWHIAAPSMQEGCARQAAFQRGIKKTTELMIPRG